jgi:hypothetical protein
MVDGASLWLAAHIGVAVVDADRHDSQFHLLRAGFAEERVIQIKKPRMYMRGYE